MFETKCPECGKDGCLVLLSATVYPRGVSICADGFDLWEAKSVDTEDEQVKCTECGHEGAIAFGDDE